MHSTWLYPAGSLRMQVYSARRGWQPTKKRKNKMTISCSYLVQLKVPTVPFLSTPLQGHLSIGKPLSIKYIYWPRMRHWPRMLQQVDKHSDNMWYIQSRINSKACKYCRDIRLLIAGFSSFKIYGEGGGRVPCTQVPPPLTRQPCAHPCFLYANYKYAVCQIRTYICTFSCCEGRRWEGRATNCTSQAKICKPVPDIHISKKQ